MNDTRSKKLSSLLKEYNNSDIIETIEKDFTKGANDVVPLSMVRFNPVSRHQFFLDRKLKDLTESIKKNGVISPLLVRKTDKGIYEVCGGYKRFYVARKLHLKEIPVSIREISDELMIYMVLSRGNKKHQDNILNRTYVYQILIDEYHVSRKDIALISKSSVSQVTNILRLAKLDEEVIIALKKEKVSYGQARVLLGLENQQQEEFLNKLLTEQISVREIEKEVKRLKKPSKNDDKIIEFENKNNCKILLTEKSINLKFSSKEELNNFLNNKLLKKDNL